MDVHSLGLTTDLALIATRGRVIDRGFRAIEQTASACREPSAATQLTG
jgi:hypothetical protein